MSDPDFLETLYRHDGRWDKYAWAVDAFAAHGATLFTTGHDLHRIRRQPLNPFFSKSKVASRHYLIQRHLDILCSRLSEFAASRKMVNLGAATTALTRDVANDFIINKSYKSLEQEDFDIAQLIASQGGGWMWRVTKHVRCVAPILTSIPIDWMIKLGDEAMRAFFGHMKASFSSERSLHSYLPTRTNAQDNFSKTWPTQKTS